MLSFVLLAHSALLADIAISTEERAKCNVYCSVMGAIGSNSVFLAHLFWDKTDLSSFRFYCLFVGILACAGFYRTVSVLKEKKPIIDVSKSHKDDNKHSYAPSLKIFAKQLLTWRNFWLFTGINLIQVFNCHFNSNFLAIFIKYFVSELATFWHSVMLSLASLLPFAAVVILAPRITKYGLYKVLQFLFFLKLGFGLFGLLFGNDAGYIFFAFYLVANKVFNETICRHGNLVVADLVDEDFSINKRFASMSSAVYGANALFTKPGQSLAPMLGKFVFFSLSKC
jgi:Na+/melibiose symporter-like transporter